MVPVTRRAGSSPQARRRQAAGPQPSARPGISCSFFPSSFLPREGGCQDECVVTVVDGEEPPIPAEREMNTGPDERPVWPKVRADVITAERRRAGRELDPSAVAQ